MAQWESALVKPYPPERMKIVQTGYDKRDQLVGADKT
jgi:hypothetical protein